jgi:hypothetical protein
MIWKPLAAILALALACAGCAPPAAKDDTASIKDGCDEAAATTFMNKVVAAPPFTGYAEGGQGQLSLTVNGDQWRKLGYGMRQQIIGIMDCADAGPGKYHASVSVKETPDGPDIMTVSQAELMQWRAGGLASVTMNGIRPEIVAIDAQAATKTEVDPGAPAQ